MDLTQLAQSLSIPPLISSTDYAHQVLRAAILRGALPAGHPLRQEEIAAQLGISRLPVREALIKLAAEGLVTLHHNRGAVVSQLSADEVEELYEIRCALEPTALRLAFPHFVDADLDRAEGIIEQTDDETDAGRWGELNWEFHRSLYQPAGRARLLDLIHTMHINVDRYLRFEMSILSYKAQSQQEHRRILDACRRGDQHLAIQLLEKHIRTAGEELTAHLCRSEAV